ncbi:hypothetical protein BOX15_Mlig019138g1 [Macrostomum lignano]|uniref:Uncharacterized protein n=1 Tax=Macrostomum lignano TaxID=282301 RepID=A0A267GJF8_9PLAT|nr:hypothetical protein BOX15_Mlig019138g1 [Macrostomum lignano]
MSSSAEQEKQQLIASIRQQLLAQSSEASATFIGEFFANQRSASGWRQALAELFANADEAAVSDRHSLPTLQLRLSEAADCLVVACAEAAGFTSADVRAVCALGSSGKPPVCGLWRGFGFRSVLEASHCPEIHSSGFHFGFELDSQQPLSCLLPVWLGVSSRWGRQIGDLDDCGVIIVLPLRPEVQSALLHSGGLASAVDPRWLLCASRLRRLVVKDAAAGVYQSYELRLLSNGCEAVIDRRTRDFCDVELKPTGSERWVFFDGGAGDLQLAVPAEPEVVAAADGGFFVAPSAGLPLLRGCGLRFLACSPAGLLRVDSARQQLLAASVSQENADLLTDRLPRLFAGHVAAWSFDDPDASAQLAAYIAAIPLRRELAEPGLAAAVHRLLARSDWLPSDAGPPAGLHPPARLLFDVPDAVRAAASTGLRRHFLPACLERSPGGFSGQRGRELATCLGLRQFRLQLLAEPLLADLQNRAPDLTAADFGLLGHLINELCCESRPADEAADPVELLCGLPCLPCRCLGDPDQPLRLLQPDSGAALLLPAASELPCMRRALAALESHFLARIFVLCPKFLAAQSGQAGHRLRRCLVEQLGVLDSRALPEFLTNSLILPVLQALAGSSCSEASGCQLALLTSCLMEAASSAGRSLASRVPLLTADSRALLPAGRHRLFFPDSFGASPRLCLLLDGGAASPPPELADWLPLHPTAYLQAASAPVSAWREFFANSLGVAAAPTSQELLRLLDDGVSVGARRALLKFLAADWQAVKAGLPQAELPALLARLREAAWIPASCVCRTADPGSRGAFRPAEVFAPSRRARQLLEGTPAAVLEDLDGLGEDNGEAFYRDVGIVTDARDPAALRRLLTGCSGLPLARLSRAASVRIYRLLAADCLSEENLGDGVEATATPILMPDVGRSHLQCRRATELMWSDLVPMELKSAPGWPAMRAQLQPHHLSLCYPPELREFFVGVCGVPAGPPPLSQLVAVLLLAGELRNSDLAWRAIAAFADAPEAASINQRLQALRQLHSGAFLPCVGGGFCALQDAPILLAPAPKSTRNSGIGHDDAATAEEGALALAAAYPGQLRLVDASERCAGAARALQDFFKLPPPGRALEVAPIGTAAALAPPQWLVKQANSELEAALTWTAASHPVVHRALSAAGCVLGLAELPCLQLRFRLRSRPELAVAAPVYEALAVPGGGQQVQLYQDNDGPAEVVAFVSSSVQNLRDPAAVASICRRLAARMLARLASQRVTGSAAVSAAELDDFRRQLMRANWPKLVAPADGSVAPCRVRLAAVGERAELRDTIPSNSALDPRVEAF